MSHTDPTPFADAPIELLCLWYKYALRGDLDSHNPPATSEEAYTQVVEAQLREMQAVAQDMCEHAEALMAEEEELVDGNLRRALAVCAKCGAKRLEHFYSSKRDGRILCGTCFQQRVGQGVARKASSPDP